MWHEGDYVGARYRIESHRGQGGHGAVYFAHDVLNDRPVALKTIAGYERLDRSERDGMGLALEREFEALARLTHPNIVEVYEFGHEGDRPFFTMAPLWGPHLIESRPAPDDPDLARWVVPLVDALRFIHRQGLVHGDVKPENVRWSARGPEGRGAGELVLTDFGLAWESGRPEPVALAGTLAYVAPEILAGQRPDPRADLYALGVTLYQLLTGRLPFDVDEPRTYLSRLWSLSLRDPREFDSRVPEPWARIVTRLLERDPRHRFDSAEAVLRELADSGVTGSREAVRSAVPLVLTPQFVGRGDVVGPVLKIAEQIRQTGRGGRIVLLTGEQGIGKTRVLEALKVRLQLEGFELLAPTRGADSGAGLLGRIVRTLLPGVARRDPDLFDRLTSDLVPLLDSDPARTAAGASEDLPERHGVLEAVARVLLSAAAEAPLVLCLDDLHRLDPLTIDALDHLIHYLREEPILVLATLLEDPSAASLLWDDVGAVDRRLEALRRATDAVVFPLRRLTLDETRAFCSSMLNLEALPSQFVERVQGATEGVPLFVEEFVRLAVEQGALRREGTDWRVDLAVLETLDIPATVRDVLARRLAALSPATRRFITPLGLLGRPVTPTFLLDLGPEVSALLGGGEAPERAELLACLDEAQAKNVVSMAPGGEHDVVLTHHQFALVLADALGPADRRRLHEAIARWLDNRRRAGLPATPHELAHHWLRAGVPAKALDHAIEAALAAETMLDYEAAVDHLERALTLLERVEGEDRPPRAHRAAEFDWPPGAPLALRLTWRLARLLQRVGRYEASLERLRSMEGEIRPDPVVQAKLARRIGTVLQRLGQLDQARERLEAGLAALDEAGDLAEEGRLTRARILTNLAVLAVTRSDLGAAERLCAASLETLGEMDEKRERAEIFNTLGYVALSRGDHEEANRLHEVALTLRRDLGDDLGLGRSYANLGTLYSAQGLADKALESCRLAEQVFVRHGYLYGVAGVRYNIGMILFRHGLDWRAAEEALESSLALRRRQRDRTGAARAMAWLALMRAFRGDFEAAVDRIRQATAARLEEVPPSSYVFSLALGAQVYQLAGDLERAVEHLVRIERFADVDIDREVRIEVQIVRSAVALAGGDVTAAVAHGAGAVEVAEELGDIELLAMALRAAGAATLMLGDTARAVNLLERSLALLEGQPFPFERARSALELARAHVYAGENRAALPLLEEAREVFRRLEAVPLLEETEDTAARLREEAIPSLRRMKDDHLRIRTLFKLGRALSQAPDLEALFERIIEALFRVLPAERVAIIFRGRNDELDVRAARTSEGDVDLDPQSLSRTIVQEVFQKGLPQLAVDAPNDPRLRGSASVHRLGIRSILAAPIKVKGRVHGCLYLDSLHRERRFVESDLDYLSLLTGQAAVALDNAILLERNRAILEELDAGILAVDRHGRITSLNAQGERLLGVPASVAVGKELSSLIEPGPFVEVLTKTLAGRPHERHLVRLASRGAARTGGARLVSLSTSLLRDPSGTVVGGLAFFRDVTDRVRREQEMLARRRLQAMGQFAANVAHRMKNFFTGIRLLAEGLERSGNDDPRVTDKVRRILDTVMEAQDFVSGQLHPVRTVSMARVNFDLRDIIRDQLDDLEEEMAAAGVVSELVLPPEPLTMPLNRNQVSEAIRNVLVNGIQAMASGGGGGRLRVETRLLDQPLGRGLRTLRISISDTGKGIPPDVLDRVFEPFFAADSQGRGVGLWQVHRTFENHGGAVRIESTPGVGTVVHLDFPFGFFDEE